MLVWLPNSERAEAVGDLEGVATEVVTDWDPNRLPASKVEVEVVVPPQAYSGDFGTIVSETPPLRIVQTLATGTVYSYDDGPAVVYGSTDRAEARRMRVIRASGGSEPSELLRVPARCCRHLRPRTASSSSSRTGTGGVRRRTPTKWWTSCERSG